MSQLLIFTQEKLERKWRPALKSHESVDDTDIGEERKDEKEAIRWIKKEEGERK